MFNYKTDLQCLRVVICSCINLLADSATNGSTITTGLDIGTYFGYSATLFVLSLVMTILIVIWDIYVYRMIESLKQTNEAVEFYG